jgi:hypothetical protein
MRYINDTSGYENISIGYTDSDGYINVYLEPDIIHKIRMSKTDFQTSIEDWTPDPTYYGIYYPKQFTLYRDEVSYMNETIYNEIITFNGYISGTTLTVNYTDSSSSTTDITIYVYEHNSSNTSAQLIYTWTQTGNNDYHPTATINTSNCYSIYLDLNHSEFGYINSYGGTICVRTGITTKTRFDTLLDLNFKHCPFGWSNLFGFFILLGSIFSFGQQNVGVSLLFTGGIMAFINSVIGLALLNVAIPAVIVSLGIIVLWGERGRVT